MWHPWFRHAMTALWADRVTVSLPLVSHTCCSCQTRGGRAREWWGHSSQRKPATPSAEEGGEKIWSGTRRKRVGTCGFLWYTTQGLTGGLDWLGHSLCGARVSERTLHNEAPWQGLGHWSDQSIRQERKKRQGEKKGREESGRGVEGSEGHVECTCTHDLLGVVRGVGELGPWDIIVPSLQRPHDHHMGHVAGTDSVKNTVPHTVGGNVHTFHWGWDLNNPVRALLWKVYNPGTISENLIVQTHTVQSHYTRSKFTAKELDVINHTHHHLHGQDCHNRNTST